MWGTNPPAPTPPEEAPPGEIPSLFNVVALRIGFFAGLCFCLFIHLGVVLISFVVNGVHTVFRSFTEGNYPYVAIDLVRLQDGVSSGSSYAAIFPAPPINNIVQMVLLEIKNICPKSF